MLFKNGQTITQAQAQAAFSRKGKYNAEKVSYKGFVFDSKKEHRRYLKLEGEFALKLISNLQVHTKFSLDVNGIHICNYSADFTYDRDGLSVVEDTKGVLTPEFKLKEKLMLAIHNIKVVRV